MGWALFAYLAIFVGYNAAREFGGSPILGGIAGAICISNAAMPLLATYNDAQIVLADSARLQHRSLDDIRQQLERLVHLL